MAVSKSNLSTPFGSNPACMTQRSAPDRFWQWGAEASGAGALGRYTFWMCGLSTCMLKEWELIYPWYIVQRTPKSKSYDCGSCRHETDISLVYTLYITFLARSQIWYYLSFSGGNRSLGVKTRNASSSHDIFSGEG